jgi:hypothetical protein
VYANPGNAYPNQIKFLNGQFSEVLPNKLTQVNYSLLLTGLANNCIFAAQYNIYYGSADKN